MTSSPDTQKAEHPAVANLRTDQRQLDVDGCMVGVSQQALYETLEIYDALLAAAEKLEEAETFNANCEECDGEGIPELCGECFPLFDDARVMRRTAIAKAKQVSQ